MPTNNDKYKEEKLIIKLNQVRDGHLHLKDVTHDPRIRHQGTFPSRKEMISMSTVYTKAKNDVIRLLKARDKKNAKASGESSESKLRVARIDQTLSTFLRLRERGLPVDLYPDTLVTSSFTDWVVRSGLQNGKEVLLMKDGYPINSAAAEFISLFKDDLKKLGSGPTIKVGQIDPKTKQPSPIEIKSSVFDENGVQINPFNMNKHMFIFASHYPQVSRNVNGKYNKRREVVSRDAVENAHLYEIMQKEHTLFTKEIGNARRKYRDAQDKLKSLQDKKDKALLVGDRTINDSITRAATDLRIAKQQYISILDANNISHNISL